MSSVSANWEQLQSASILLELSRQAIIGHAAGEVETFHRKVGGPSIYVRYLMKSHIKRLVTVLTTRDMQHACHLVLFINCSQRYALGYAIDAHGCATQESAVAA